MLEAMQQESKGRPALRRRQFKRAQVDLPSLYSLIEVDCIRQGYASIIDLSAGGIRMVTATQFVQGMQIMLRFTLPGGQREVYVYGRIVISFFDGPRKQYSHGVAFTQISAADQDAIVCHIDDVLDSQRIA